MRKAERILQSPDDAMDIVQTLFVDMIARSPKSLDLAYLYSAVTNRCLNLLRDQQVRTRLLAERAPELRGPERVSLGDSVLSLELLVRLVARLDQKSSEIVVYHFIDDLNQEEVAGQVGMSRRAVVKRLAKIRQVAREMVAADETLASGEQIS